MGLMALFEKTINGDDATAIDAIHAIEKPKIATIARIAVASSPKPKKEDRHLRLIQNKGISDKDAEYLARKLARRDAQLDDRKSCAECRNFTPRGCRIGQHPIGQTTMFDLHRAPCFESENNN